MLNGMDVRSFGRKMGEGFMKLKGDGVDFSLVGENEEFSLGVFDEGGGPEITLRIRTGVDFTVGDFLTVFLESPEGAETPVSVEVMSMEGGNCFTLIV